MVGAGDQHRPGSRVQPQDIFKDLQPVTIGQIHVQQNHVKSVSPSERAGRLIGRTNRVGIESMRRQQVLQGPLGGKLILNDQDSH